MYLSLKANSLTVGAAMTFSLSIQDTIYVAVGAITITVNSPPYGGAFLMYPQNGTEVVDTFSYVASLWSDIEDLPLYYQFGYISPTRGNTITQVSKNRLSYGSSSLPAGISAQDFEVSGQAEIFDSLGAYTTTTYVVSVFELTDINLDSYINGTDNSYGASADAIRQQTALASSLLNRVSCDAAPSSCAILYNRQDCLNTLDTCGPCLPEHIGDSEDSNSLCVPDNGNNNNYQGACLNGVLNRNQNNIPTCSVASDCPGGCIWQTCVTGQCMLETKSCVADCSGEGTCKFLRKSNKQELTACYNGDSTCEAVCECNAGYSGSTCGYTDSEISDRQALRSMLVESVADLVNGEDADAASVSSWFETLLECSDKPDELSFDVATRVMSLSFDFLNSAIDIKLPTNAAASALDILNSATTASAYEIANSAARRARNLLAVNSGASGRAASSLIQFDRHNLKQIVVTAHQLSHSQRSRRARALLLTDSSDGALDGRMSALTSSDVNMDLSDASFGRILSVVDISNNLQDTINAVNAYGTLASTNMQPGQTPHTAVYDLFRLNVEVISTEELSQVGALSGVSSRATLQLPRNQLEEEFQQSSIALPITGGSTGDQVSVTAMSLGATLYGTESGEFKSSPLTVHTSPSPPCVSNATSDCYIEFTIQYSEVVDLIIDAVETETIQCFEDDYFAYPYECENGEVLDVACNGTSGYFDYNCSRTVEEAVCNSLDSNGIAEGSTGCTVVASTPTNITCACLMVAARASGFAPTEAPTLSPSGGEDYEVSIVSMLTSTTDTFEEVFSSAKDLTLRTVENNWTVVLTLGVLALFGLFLVVWSDHYDRIDRETLKKRIDEFGIARFGQSRDLVHDGRLNGGAVLIKSEAGKDLTSKEIKENTTKVENKVKLRFETALPRILMTSTEYSVKLISEYVARHKWMNIFSTYTATVPRAMRVLAIYSDMIIMLFVNCVVYNLVDPDDGTCEEHDNESDCLAEPSVLNAGIAKCQWTGAEGQYYDIHGFCEFRQPDDSIMSMIYVAFIAAVLTIPLTVLVKVIISNVLILPTKNEHDESLDEDVLVDTTIKPTEKQKNKEAAILEVEEMQQRVQMYRARVSGKERDAFDELWGIDPSTGTFRSTGGSGCLNSLLNKVPGMHVFNTAGKNRLQGYLTRIEMMQQLERNELEAFKFFKSNDYEVGKRIVFLFLCDLLPQMQGSILNKKGAKEFVKPKKINKIYKWIGWGFIGLLVAGMLFYMLLFAITRGKQYQRAWLISFLIYFFTDLFFVSTLTTTFRDIWIPSIIEEDVSVAQSDSLSFFQTELRKMKEDAGYKNKVAAIFGNASKKSDLSTSGDLARTSSLIEQINTARGTDLNASKYFFLSTRIAEHFPHIKESKLVLLYSTLFPPPLMVGSSHKVSAQTRQIIAEIGSSRTASAEGDGSERPPPPTFRNKIAAYYQMFVLLFLFYLLMIPEQGVDSFFEIVMTFVMAWCVVGSLALWNIHPSLAIVVPIVIIGSIYLLFRFRKHRRSPGSNAGITQIVPLKEAEAKNDSDAELNERFAESSAAMMAGEDGLVHAVPIDAEDVELLDFPDFFTDTFQSCAKEFLGANPMKKAEDTELLRQLPENLRAPPEKPKDITSKEFPLEQDQPREAMYQSARELSVSMGPAICAKPDDDSFSPHRLLAGSAKPGARSLLRGSSQYPQLGEFTRPKTNVRQIPQKPKPVAELNSLEVVGDDQEAWSEKAGTTKWARHMMSQRPKLDLTNAADYNEVLVNPSPANILSRLDKQNSQWVIGPSVSLTAHPQRPRTAAGAGVSSQPRKKSPEELATASAAPSTAGPTSTSKPYPTTTDISDSHVASSARTLHIGTAWSTDPSPNNTNMNSPIRALQLGPGVAGFENGTRLSLADNAVHTPMPRPSTATRKKMADRIARQMSAKNSNSDDESDDNAAEIDEEY